MKHIQKWLLSTIVILTLTACSLTSSDPENRTINEGQSDNVQEPIQMENDNAESVISDNDQSGTVIIEHTDLHEEVDDYSWNTDEVVVVALENDSIQADSSNVAIQGMEITISAAGNYQLNGVLSDGQIVVNAGDDALVRLLLDDVDIYNSDGPAIYIANAKKTIIVLSNGSNNTLKDGSAYVLEDPESDEPNATIFSEDAMTITGSGSLIIYSNCNDVIGCKEGLIINGGSHITINSVDDGIRGKAYLVIDGVSLDISSDGDGLKSDQAEDRSKGFITIESGTIKITSGADAIEAETDITIVNGVFDLMTGSGSSAFLDETTSRKGIKATRSLVISGGSFEIDSADDGLHSNDTMIIQGGTITIATGDDGLHADASINIDGGTIYIVDSNEGIESAVIRVNAGEIKIVSSDDGINLAGGADGSGFNAEMPEGGADRRGGRGGPGQDMFATSGDYCFYFNGGTIRIVSGGDGIDSNGSIEMIDGTLLIDGPTESMNGALDYLGTFNISGGIIVAAGSAGMATAPNETSSQPSVFINFDSFIEASTLIHIENESGETILTYAPSKHFQSLVVSTPELQMGETYHIMVGGMVDSSNDNGLLMEGTYSGGSEYTSFTITSIITQIGRRGMYHGW